MVSLGKYNLEVINHINIFENITKARVKDCFIDGNNKFVFIVNKEDIGRAIGKNGMNLKRVENVLKKRIKVVSFSDDVKEFVVSYSNPVKIEGVTVNDNIVEIKVNGMRERGLLIGRDKKHLEALKQILKKYYNIEDVKIV